MLQWTTVSLAAVVAAIVPAKVHDVLDSLADSGTISAYAVVDDEVRILADPDSIFIQLMKPPEVATIGDVGAHTGISLLPRNTIKIMEGRREFYAACEAVPLRSIRNPGDRAIWTLFAVGVSARSIARDLQLGRKRVRMALWRVAQQHGIRGISCPYGRRKS